MVGEFDFHTFEARKIFPGVETGLSTRVECRTSSSTSQSRVRDSGVRKTDSPAPKTPRDTDGALPAMNNEGILDGTGRGPGPFCSRRDAAPSDRRRGIKPTHL